MANRQPKAQDPSISRASLLSRFGLMNDTELELITGSFKLGERLMKGQRRAIDCVRGNERHFL